MINRDCCDEATLFNSQCCSHNVHGHGEGVVNNDDWSTEAHEWDVCCGIPYPTVSAELFSSKQFYLNLHYIGLSAEPLSGADFASPSGAVFFLHNAWNPTPWHQLLFSPLFIHLTEVLTTAGRKQHTSRAVSELLIPSHKALTICHLSYSLSSTAFPITRRKNP